MTVSHSYYVLFIHVLTFSRVFLYNVIKRNNNLDIIHRGKKKNYPIYNIKCRLHIWTVKKYVNFCKVWNGDILCINYDFKAMLHQSTCIWTCV